MWITRQKLQDEPYAVRPVGVGRRVLLILLALLLPCVSVAQTSSPLILSGSVPQGAMVGVLAAGTDSVFVNRALATPGRAIFEGDVVQTDASGRARLDLLDFSTLHLAGNSDLRVARVVRATAERPATVILDMKQGVARMISGTPDRAEIALIRGAGAIASSRGGALDMVASTERLVTAMRSGSSSCRSASGQILTMSRSQRVCILSQGSIRPSTLSMAMKRVIDKRLSVPPSAIARAVSSSAFTHARTSSGAMPGEQRANTQTQSAFAATVPTNASKVASGGLSGFTPQGIFSRLTGGRGGQETSAAATPTNARQQPAQLTVQPITLTRSGDTLMAAEHLIGLDSLPLFGTGNGDFLDNGAQAPQNGD